MSMPLVIVRACMRVRVYKCRNAGLFGNRSVRYCKLMMPGLVQYQTKLMKSGLFLVRYWMEIMNAGMPMPALVCSMPMPSYVYKRHSPLQSCMCAHSKKSVILQVKNKLYSDSKMYKFLFLKFTTWAQTRTKKNVL
jgi:hypothetical protein